MIRLRGAVVIGGLGLSGVAHALCEPGGLVRINEAMVDPEGSDAGSEWIELYNAGPVTVELEGWEIESDTAPGGNYSNAFLLPAGATIAPGEHLVIGDLLVSFPGVSLLVIDQVGTGLGNNATAEDALRLVDCAGGVADVLVYGASAEHDGDALAPYFVDALGGDVDATRLAPASTEGRSIARTVDGADTGNNAADFSLLPPTPGRANDAVISSTCTSAGTPHQVVINELLPAPGREANPDGTDGGWEWIELYNAAAVPVDVSGWQLQQAGAPDDWGSRVKYTLPDGSVMPAGGRWVVSDGLATFPEDAVVLRIESGTLGLGNSQDGVRLVDCGGVMMDQIVYGGTNPDGFLDEAGVLLDEQTVGPAVKDDQSIARRADGLDTDNNGADLVLTDPSPGEPNEDLSCRTRNAEVFLNEALPNPNGADSDNQVEFVELYNAGDTAVDISTWTVRKATSLEDDGSLAPDVLYSLGSGAVIEPHGFYVIAGVMFEGEAQEYGESFDLPSGSNGDLLALYSCTGARIDGLLYGGPNVDRLKEDDGFIPDDGAVAASENACLARRSDGGDSDVSKTDFVLTRYCSPGATNVRDGSITDPIDGPKGGCRSGPRDVSVRPLDTTPGCDQRGGGAIGGLGWAAFALGWLRRRR